MPWIYVISDLNGEEIVGTFYEEELITGSIKKILYKNGLFSRAI